MDRLDLISVSNQGRNIRKSYSQKRRECQYKFFIFPLSHAVYAKHVRLYFDFKSIVPNFVYT